MTPLTSTLLQVNEARSSTYVRIDGAESYATIRGSETAYNYIKFFQKNHF